MLCQFYILSFFEVHVGLFAARGHPHAVGAAGHHALARDSDECHFARRHLVDFLHRIGNLLLCSVLSNIKSVHADLAEVGGFFGDAGRYKDVSGVFFHTYIFLLKVATAISGEAMTRYLAESAESGVRLRTSSTATLPKLRKDLMVGAWRLGRAMSAPFFFFIRPTKCLPSVESTMRAAAALGTCISMASTKITSPSLYLRESATKSAFWLMARLTLRA